MSTGNTQLRQIAGAEDKPRNFPAMLQQFKGEIAAALPKHLNPDRMARIALTCFRRTPKLDKCEPTSVFAAVIQASQLGLEPGIGGQAYLIPYGTECQFVPGWQGLVDLVQRAGRATIWTGAVYEGDDFDYGLGDSPFVKHRPGERGNEDEKDLRYVYAVGRVKGSDWPIIEVWPIAKVWKHRDRFNKVGKGHYSFAHGEMYARKVVLLQVLKYMPKSPELLAAMALDDGAARGQQGLTLKDAIDGTYAPVPDDASTVDADERIDTRTGEIIPSEGTSAGLQRAVADIRSAIQRATTVDQVALQQDMARHVKDERLRGELEAAAKEKLRELGESAGA